MSLFLRMLEIMLTGMLGYTYQATIRMQYRPFISRVLPYPGVGLILILISPWLSVTLLRFLLHLHQYGPYHAPPYFPPVSRSTAASFLRFHCPRTALRKVSHPES